MIGVCGTEGLDRLRSGFGLVEGILLGDGGGKFFGSARLWELVRR